jgi:sterol desaturase/sphingolipid hydroxylase (fatty acid hydroxylase superfamily)
MHADIELRRGARAQSGRHLLIILCAVLAALAVAAWAVEAAILLPASVIARFDEMAAALNSWANAQIPSTALPFVRTLAGLAISPLLYLGLAAVLLAERLAPADQNQQPISRGMIQDGIAWFLLDAPLKGLLYAGFLGLLYWMLDNWAQFLRIDVQSISAAPTGVLVLLAVVVSDFLRWIHHILSHKVPVLWHFHSVHHSQRELNLFTQARFHAVDFAMQVPILYTPLYVLNLDFELAVWIVLLTDWYGRITHANLRTNYGVLRYALVTPQSHRIHHSRERRHIDKNFGILFSVWDRLFGTQWPNHDDYPPTGIADEHFPWEATVHGLHVLSNYFAQLIYPFRQLFKSRHARIDGAHRHHCNKPLQNCSPGP